MFRKTKPLLLLIIVFAAFLRLVALDKVPVSMFGDELDVGYQAYSILKTGKDYYGNFMPLHFHSLAEWRTPLYLYSSVPTVAIFGISPYGVRLPAAIFGTLTIYIFYLFIKEVFKNEKLALLGALILALSPWHIQYSRAAFEVTQLLFFLLLALLFFVKALKNSKWLWLSALCFALTPWVYSTAKLFTPLFMVGLFGIWFKDIVKFSKKHLLYALITLIVVGGPIAYSTLFGGGSQRYGYISVFTDPTTEPEVGTARGEDAKARGENGTGLNPTKGDRLIHNKFTFWGEKVITNYLQPFSAEFLFNSGDPNLRHSIEDMGVLYKVEIIGLALGLIYFYAKYDNKKVKVLFTTWIILGVLPASITRDGGNHATRLILILLPLVTLITYGLFSFYTDLSKSQKTVFALVYIGLFAANFFFYQHNFWIHNPTYSERWWHAGYGEAISAVKSIDSNYDGRYT